MRRYEERIRRYRRVEKDLVLFCLDFSEAHRSKMFQAETGGLPYVVTDAELEAWCVAWVARRFPCAPPPASLQVVLVPAGEGIVVSFPELVDELLHRDEQDAKREAEDAARMRLAEQMAERQPTRGCIIGDSLCPLTPAHAALLEMARDAYLRDEPMAAIRDIVTNAESPIWDGSLCRLDGLTVSMLPVYREVSDIARMRGIEQGILIDDGPRAVQAQTAAQQKRMVN